jgi:RND family efflux transporter MFP subunit
MPGSNTVLFRLVVDRPLKLQVTVPERYRSEVKLGQEAALEVEAHPGQRFPGKVARINPTIDRASRTFQVEILVPNEDRKLSPGSFAKASIFTKVDPKARTVPEEALVTFAGITKVFVIENDHSREVHVKPGARLPVAGPSRQRTWIEVEGDLPEGAMVATSGHSQLSNGKAVRLRTPAPSSEGTKSP